MNGNRRVSAGGLRILVVRLGAMGDIIHALPAAASLKHSFPGCRLAWIVERKWSYLLAGNPFLDQVIPIERSLRGLLEARRALHEYRYDLAVDFQGLIKSAVVASLSRSDRIFGFHHSQLREPLAALVYSNRILAASAHVVDRNLELAAAAGASNPVHAFPLPAGASEGELPGGPFVLACPLAGWTAKQWPLEFYSALAQLLPAECGLPLVVNGPPPARKVLEQVEGALVHVSGVPGLLHATRRATAVIGVDSGPLHLAAALDKPGVAIFGPTDPARNGPYRGSLTVLRDPGAVTSYKRLAEIDPSMRRVTPGAVLDALRPRLAASISSAGTPA